MIFKLLIDKTAEESVVVTAHEASSLTDEIEKLVLREGMTNQIPGYDGDEITLLELSKVECFYVSGEKTYAVYTGGMHYLVRSRLYELEQRLPPSFERISKSAIANWKRIDKLKVQLSGAVDAVFKSGYTECISRRCFADLRKRYGL